jgi:hypothetical protein
MESGRSIGVEEHIAEQNPNRMHPTISAAILLLGSENTPGGENRRLGADFSPVAARATAEPIRDADSPQLRPRRVARPGQIQPSKHERPGIQQWFGGLRATNNPMKGKQR